MRCRFRTPYKGTNKVFTALICHGQPCTRPAQKTFHSIPNLKPPSLLLPGMLRRETLLHRLRLLLMPLPCVCTILLFNYPMPIISQGHLMPAPVVFHFRIST